MWFRKTQRNASNFWANLVVLTCDNWKNAVSAVTVYINRMSTLATEASYDDLEDATKTRDSLLSRRTHRDWLTNFCRTISFLTSFCALLCLMAHATALVHNVISDAEAQAFPRDNLREDFEKTATRLSEHVLRVTGLVCSVLVILAETEWSIFIHYFTFLDFWINRGFFQLSVASLTQLMAHAEGESDLARSVTLYRSIASASLAACGVFYVVSGMVCIGAMRRARRYRDIEQARLVQDLEEVDMRIGAAQKRRLELQSLLHS
ncbi:hypothetical protein CYMTET_51608 [Cymbomonas tetramitiformis]|uniref:Transmembrane protein n=1 Tax=Cymbomonas tetramitiformis TaxID=36881 RepID=A0AAE0ESG6_9CHLO|nr:hypothetical protein CYMTET_51608 [Cymbomonas tetramitiformis]